jgi:hypothetical protein
MPKKSTSDRSVAAFIESMECLPVTKLPEGPEWTYELSMNSALRWDMAFFNIELSSSKNSSSCENLFKPSDARERMPKGHFSGGQRWELVGDKALGGCHGRFRESNWPLIPTT